MEHICTMLQFPEGWHGRTSSPSGHVSGHLGQLLPDNQDIKIEYNRFLANQYFS